MLEQPRRSAHHPPPPTGHRRGSRTRLAFAPLMLYALWTCRGRPDGLRVRARHGARRPRWLQAELRGSGEPQRCALPQRLFRCVKIRTFSGPAICVANLLALQLHGYDAALATAWHAALGILGGVLPGSSAGTVEGTTNSLQSPKLPTGDQPSQVAAHPRTASAYDSEKHNKSPFLPAADRPRGVAYAFADDSMRRTNPAGGGS